MKNPGSWNILRFNTKSSVSPCPSSDSFLGRRRKGKGKTRGERGDALDLGLPGILEPGPHNLRLLLLPLFLCGTRWHGIDVLIKSVYEAEVF